MQRVSWIDAIPHLLQEVALIGMLAYLSYLCGDWLGLSGIVALFCCAVTISHYALHNVSSLSRVTTVSAFQTLSYVSEGAIFIYVGMDTLDPLKWQVPALLCSRVMGCRVPGVWVVGFSRRHTWQLLPALHHGTYQLLIHLCPLVLVLFVVAAAWVSQ